MPSALSDGRFTAAKLFWSQCIYIAFVRHVHWRSTRQADGLLPRPGPSFSQELACQTTFKILPNSFQFSAVFCITQKVFKPCPPSRRPHSFRRASGNFAVSKTLSAFFLIFYRLFHTSKIIKKSVNQYRTIFKKIV